MIGNLGIIEIINSLPFNVRNLNLDLQNNQLNQLSLNKLSEKLK